MGAERKKKKKAEQAAKSKAAPLSAEVLDFLADGKAQGVKRTLDDIPRAAGGELHWRTLQEVLLRNAKGRTQRARRSERAWVQKKRARAWVYTPSPRFPT